MTGANTLRGEAPLRIGSVDLTIAIDFGSLVRFSEAARCQDVEQVYRRLVGFEPRAVALAIRLFSISEDGPEEAQRRAIAAIQELTLADQDAWTVAIESALAGHIDKGKALRDVEPLVESVERQVREAEAALSGGGDATAPGKKP
jgi:hypothetical protein